MNALVVDNSRLMRKVLIGVLSRIGVTDVEQAGDGNKAVDACANQDFALVLMDWNLPNMSGFDALKAIRGAGKTMPIIMVTTESEKSRVVEALKAGANDYIIKPFKPHIIMAKIQDTLEKA